MVHRDSCTRASRNARQVGEGGASTQSDDVRRENQAPREPVSTLNAAIGRINITLDLDTVPGEAVTSARALAGACYGV